MQDTHIVLLVLLSNVRVDVNVAVQKGRIKVAANPRSEKTGLSQATQKQNSTSSTEKFFRLEIKDLGKFRS